MADLSAFSNISFNCVKWIDNMISDKSNEESIDSFIASLTMKLHIVSQEYTDQLEGGKNIKKTEKMKIDDYYVFLRYSLTLFLTFYFLFLYLFYFFVSLSFLISSSNSLLSSSLSPTPSSPHHPPSNPLE